MSAFGGDINGCAQSIGPTSLAAAEANAYRRRWLRDTAVLPPAAGAAVLTNRDKYLRQLHECRAQAECASGPEISALWATIADSWHFLLEREDRLARDGKWVDIGLLP